MGLLGDAFHKYIVAPAESWAEDKVSRWIEKYGVQAVDSAASAAGPLVEQGRQAIQTVQQTINGGGDGAPSTSNTTPGGDASGASRGGDSPPAAGTPAAGGDTIWGKILGTLGSWLRGGKPENAGPDDQGDDSIWGKIGGFAGKALSGIVSFLIMLVSLFIGGSADFFQGLGDKLGLSQDAAPSAPGAGLGERIMTGIKHYGHVAYEAIGNTAGNALSGFKNAGQKIENFTGNRGIRDNNLGNITGNDNWVGKVGMDDRFVVFDTREHGLRAMAVVLQKKQGKTLAEIISSYAPANENDTNSYISQVSQKTGIAPNARPDTCDADTLCSIMGAMTHVEVGKTYDPALIKTAVNDALNIQTPEVLMARSGRYSVQDVNASPTAAPRTPPGMSETATALG